MNSPIIPFLIEGGMHSDDRGTMSFNNDFDMKDVRRFYSISPIDTDTVRAWQGHKKEAKWFFCTLGSFIVRVVTIDDWDSPSLILKPLSFHLSATNSQILYIPPGCANGLMATSMESSLLVFSNKTLDEAKSDDIRFDKSMWGDWSDIL